MIPFVNNTVIYWEPSVGWGQTVVPDACISQEHKGSNQVTSHPVELGVNISDHIITDPDELTMECFFSSHVCEPAAGLRNPIDRAAQFYEKLMDLKDKGYLAIVVTKLRQYESMALVSMSAPRSAELGDSVQVNLTFRQVKTVQSKTVDAPTPTVDRAKSKKVMGRKDTKPASSKVELKTDIITALLGLI